MIRTASVTELRDTLAETLGLLETEEAVMVLRHSKPAAYLVSPRLFESLVACIEDLEDIRDVRIALEEYHQEKSIPAEEVFTRLGL